MKQKQFDEKLKVLLNTKPINKMERQQSFTDTFFEQAVNISKAHGYDILCEQVKELKSENEILRIELKAANAMIEAYKEYVNSTKNMFAVSAELPKPTENDLKDINI